jgi:hypothetical protein
LQDKADFSNIDVEKLVAAWEEEDFEIIAALSIILLCAL